MQRNVKVHILNSTLIENIGKVNNINDETNDAVASIIALSMGMQKKSNDIRKNAEVSRIFSRYL